MPNPTLKPRNPNFSEARLRRRYAADRRLQAYGRTAVALALFFLFLLLGTVVMKGYKSFTYTRLQLEVSVAAPLESLEASALQGLLYQELYDLFPEASDRDSRRALRGLISANAGDRLLAKLQANPALLGQRLRLFITASDEVDLYSAGEITRATPEAHRRFKDRDMDFVDALFERGLIDRAFNLPFFTQGNSSEPEEAGILGALVGSLLMLFVCLVLSFPVGILAAIYLELFARKGRLTDFVEININNLAAVPSIIFGLLGLAIFLNVFGLPRAAPLVAGMVLALMTLPTIIIASRAALRAVPPSVREAALGIGASHQQVVWHHILPLALPGMLTGTIIGMAQALGETAPLLMIGMVAFVADAPTSLTDPATALPVQIYLWADQPERAFQSKTYAAIMVLLGFLLFMNALAIFLRKKFERRW